MNPERQKFILLLIVFCLATLNVGAQAVGQSASTESPLPRPTSPVTDQAGVLDAGTKQNLERRLIEFRDKTNPKVELAVALVRTTNDRPIFDYSLAVARGWGIGSKETDNPSALLFIAIDDRKYFTQVSRDLEDELPDGVVGQLQRQYLVPAFRQQNYAKGVTDTIEAYIKTIESKQTGETVGQTETADKETKASIGIGSCAMFLCLGILLIFFLANLSRKSKNKNNRNDNDRWRGGGFGGGTSDSILPWIIGSAIGSSLGNSSSDSSSDWGGSSGGGDSWGGFGGGGDFGGGGAGGDW